ncbi:putative RWD, RING finger and WD repeat-containing protein-like protein [Hapsidospora chrysogenum ATCC 11550]|uniref:Putative RWD, RING finger and WD repeat-containing protein-like protein n=1 Tax=Hapsidospora chrysogenum (strain ATCC 11550 / CBS 779.69 / DSM 880 / IAM 14645 / JCM 23072 / IMI 49137) TaxID=857340 RepID=A0A086TCB3_HAPC1|nr:putative RWD, RING finger and WD repeat-containing protein-like protein [Hapsidospora chrysogenum ATCC 11550]
MPSFDQADELPKKGKIIKSAYDSESFESDGTIHVDGLVGSATISPSGRDIALASPDGLAIIDLDSPYNPPRRIRSHGLPWLVTDVQWSPFAARDYWVVSTANHRALVWNLNLREDSTSGAIEHSLQGHSRAITDINFSAHHPDILATCSVDGYVHTWDLRRPRQPALTFCDWFAGATQVKYNRQDPHIMASSHGRWLHIWDERRACEPLRSISAHTSKIYGVDWNRIKPTAIVTCSLDKSIKFWDYSQNVEEPESVIHTEYPVWRARHTPFGRGLLAMPQNEPGDLYLYDRRRLDEAPKEKLADPVAVFPGHGHHKVKEFLWRSRGGISEDGIDNREFQLVSWGADNELRLQCIDSNILSAVGYTKGSQAPKGLNLTRKGAVYKTFRTVDDNSNLDRKNGTMSDARSGTGHISSKQSALTLSMRSGTQGRHAKAGWRGPSMKAKVKSKRDHDQSQIGWLKGITITKRKTSGPGAMPKRQMSKDSSVFGHGYPGDDWAEPDTVQEELLRISTQIPKVKWENINMDNLTLKASLNGPWGVGGETIFIKVRIDIPEDYPTKSAPKFFVEQTSFLPEETQRHITRELHQLAGRFLRRKKNCLEVAFTYLLGEVDLETSTTFFKNVRDLEDDDDLTGLVDESSSSEEDEDIPTGGSASMSQELVPHADADTALATPHRAIIPPPPRTCGARFAPDGRLICFFPTKEQKAKVLFSGNAEAPKDRPKGEPFFAGFGRLSQEAPPKHRYNGDEASATEDVYDSDESEGSSSSSSDSESTSIHKLNLWYHPTRQLRKTWSEDRSVRSSGGGTGTGAGTGTGTATSRRRIGRPRNLVSIHDMRGLLPSKKELAQEYSIFGDGADVCEHNAAVADKHGYKDIADIWRYLTLLLRKGIPLEVLSQDTRRGSILVIAHDIVSRCRGAGSPDSGYASSSSSDGLSGRVKWGEHPLAQKFIADLFDYFEKIADIQMLAMLSCIFSDTSAEDSVAYAESQLPDPVTPLPLKAPSFSLNYYPTDAPMWNLYGKSRTASLMTTPRTPLTPYYAGSQASEEVIWTGDPNSYSCGETPPARAKGSLGGMEISHGGSKSPHTGGTSKANTSLASSFTGLSRSFTGGSSASPPNHGKKKPSPVETIISSLHPGGTNSVWGSSNTMGDSSVGRTSLDYDDEDAEEENLPLVPVSVSVYVEDQTMFDDDGWLSAPLLEQSRASCQANYRYAYAEMLQMWNEPLARLEIMKFSIIKAENPSSSAIDGSLHDSYTIHEGSGPAHHPRTGSSPTIVMGKKDQLHALVASGRGLDVTGICRIHETQLEPTRYTSSGARMGGAVGSCDRCHYTQSQLRCVYCLEPVDALFPPCLSCGCSSHEACLAEWHAGGETRCPAGDECNCVEEASNGHVESWAALQGAMLKSQQQQQQQQKLPRLPSPALEADEEDERGRRASEPPDMATTGLGGGLMTVPSAATLSFGRLKKTATGSWSRASSARRSGKKG